MTLVHQATTMREKLPVRSQQVVVDLLKMLSGISESPVIPKVHDAGFQRPGKSDFALPADFDEHFDDVNDEIATMFMSAGL